MLQKYQYYASIMPDAPDIVLCSKLCGIVRQTLAGSSYFSFVVCFIVPFTANKMAAESEERRENYSVSSSHKHSSFKVAQ